MREPTVPSHARHRGLARQVPRLLVMAVAVLALSLPGQAVWSAPSGGLQQPARTPSATTVKYYVVAASADGQREYLYAIASRTLGNGNRYQEIFDLNKNRLQPDGGRLTDPLVLEPGWILVLPPDAAGPGVHTGPLPKVTASSIRTPTSAPPPPTVAVAPAPDPTGSGDTDPLWLWIAASSVALALIMVGVRLVVGARLRRDAAGAAGPAASPSALPAASTRVLALPAATPRPADGAPPTGPEPPGPPARTGRAAPAALRPSAPQLPLPQVPGPRSPEPPAAVGAGPASWRVHDELTELSAELIGHGQPVTVSLIGSRAKAPAFTWVDGDAEPPAGTAPALLGEQGGRRLYADLALAPDVVTVLGGLPECQRYARELAERLSAAGVEVAVLRDALGATAPAGCRQIASMPDPDAPGEACGPVSVVFCAAPDAAERRRARDLCTRGNGRVVPVLLGEVPRSRWSMRVSLERPALPADPDGVRGD